MAALIALSAGACTSNDAQNEASDRAGKEAIDKYGATPKIKNYAEYKMAQEVFELRDRTDVVMYAYLQGNDGALRCYGKVVGYGIPYATQVTPPNSGTEPVREPNGLFMPDSAEATWLRVIDESTGKTAIEYVEPRVLVSPVKRACKPLDQ
jgi:hypothetical protein